jgi:hypothetical protein
VPITETRRAERCAIFPRVCPTANLRRSEGWGGLHYAVADTTEGVVYLLLQHWVTGGPSGHHQRRARGWPDRLANRVTEALARPALPTRDYPVRAKAASIRLAAIQLLALHTTRRDWERRMGELLLGGPHTGRDHTVKDPDPGSGSHRPPSTRSSRPSWGKNDGDDRLGLRVLWHPDPASGKSLSTHRR